MMHVDLGGQAVPMLGFGTWRLRDDACLDATRHALSLGYRHIDTAAMYENEAEVGQAIADASVARADVFVTTKVWMTELQADKVRASLESSLRELKTDYVDLTLIHWPSDDVPLAETLEALGQLRDEGKTRHIGVSNFRIDQMEAAHALGPVVNNQVELHPFLAQPKLRLRAQELGIVMTAYAPIARGKVANDETLIAIGAELGKSPIQVTLRWLLQSGVVAIPKAASAEHRAANLDIFDIELTPAQMQAIDGLDRQERLINPAWARFA